ncbi:prolyl oligopeptidase family serine peptidase [Microlunatus ginsengisoli]|uniref:Prolyl oligopeptidase family serine peptidase n=1 Tax=Microlunatus ginsengisoli TaxID=363863 RepID=A0ABP6ZPV4_9ACTN
MSTPIPRRTLLTAAGAAAVGISAPSIAQAGGRPSATVRFTLNAETLDGGEQVTAVTLNTKGLEQIVPASLTPDTFTVHAKATSPIPIAPGDQIFSEYDLDRVVTTARLDRRGNIVLELDYAEGQLGGGTLGYIVSKGRNVQLRLVYTITQNAPLRLRNGKQFMIKKLAQGELSNPEVDRFGYATSRSKLKYRLFSPTHRGHDKRPLIVWLHGGGEGASLPDNYYDNETTLRANRGALGFATHEAQRIFGGAYVVAPQSTSYWIEDGDRFAPQIKEIIDEVARRYPIDRDRIHVVGCSNGGYMTMKMEVVYPRLFASAVPICGVVEPFGPSNTPLISDAQLKRIGTPTWLVASADDDTVDPVANTEHAHDLIPHSLMTLYDHVIWDDYQFPGHWSWIYVARNDPKINGTHIWQWMARHRN